MTNKDKLKLGMELFDIQLRTRKLRERHTRELEELQKELDALSDRWAQITAEDCDLDDREEK